MDCRAACDLQVQGGAAAVAHTTSLRRWPICFPTAGSQGPERQHLGVKMTSPDSCQPACQCFFQVAPVEEASEVVLDGQFSQDLP